MTHPRPITKHTPSLSYWRNANRLYGRRIKRRVLKGLPKVGQVLRFTAHDRSNRLVGSYFMYYDDMASHSGGSFIAANTNKQRIIDAATSFQHTCL